MSPMLTRILSTGAIVLVLVTVNWSILGKERIRSDGEVILLELAPVDPRSLMQGDYMALRFQLADAIDAKGSGRAPLILDGNGVARLHPEPQAATLHIRYRVQNRGVWLGTNAYFFEEGTADRFTDARFGEFRLDRATGEAVLTGLRDENFQPL